jgi:hypothetical protein
MSRRLHRAPFALASDGTVLVNMTEFDGPRSLAALLNKATEQKGRVFVGVQLTPAEIRWVLARLDEGCQEAAAYVAGGRQRRAAAAQE